MTRSGYRWCGRCGQNRQERFFQGKKGRFCLPCQKRRRSKASHAKRIADEYALTADEYAAILSVQGGRCAIHGGAQRARLQVDHDHDPAKPFVRGLLCGTCNTILGRWRDSVEILRRAIQYLESPPAFDVIGQRRVKNAHVREAKCGTEEGQQVRAPVVSDRTDP